MSNKKQWHFSDWSVLGWLETGLKTIAFILLG